MNDIKKIIGTNISVLRQGHKMTQLDLAEKLNYTDKAVSKWERGDSVPDVLVLKQIADLFGVTVDFLLTNTSEKVQEQVIEKPRALRNRLIITLLSTLLVWFIATALFVIGNIFFSDFERGWLFFVTAVPVSCVVLLVFNSIWGRKKLNYIIISALAWSFLTCVYLWFYSFNLWAIFLLGIPAQIIIILWSGIKKRSE
ncbi:MAG: helix-turn-helix transcriptional regulator [Ruminococcaceae bacterium]|nr:helix-turn-helix transcriptional regulator [Oscillospiraceae bacterium]